MYFTGNPLLLLVKFAYEYFYFDFFCVLGPLFLLTKETLAIFTKFVTFFCINYI